MSTTTEAEFIGEDQNANVTAPATDPEGPSDQHVHTPGEDEQGNALECSDPGCWDRPRS